MLKAVLPVTFPCRLLCSCGIPQGSKDEEDGQVCRCFRDTIYSIAKVDAIPRHPVDIEFIVSRRRGHEDLAIFRNWGKQLFIEGFKRSRKDCELVIFWRAIRRPSPYKAS